MRCTASDSTFTPSTLSQGQRQLFSLARAELERRIGGTSVLLLDEITSSIDAATESKMMETMMGEFHNATVIMVSHRLGIVVDMFERMLVQVTASLRRTERRVP
ncbi:ATP-dependent bile acid permease [Beauveria bassiana]|nr:ATP-dependent bile acid permease [Beauveria bassiana]KAH8709612.1 ATP-dependent bile acid permease [Beauveria bassiana]